MACGVPTQIWVERVTDTILLHGQFVGQLFTVTDMYTNRHKRARLLGWCNADFRTSVTVFLGAAVRSDH